MKQMFCFSDIMGHPSKQRKIYAKRRENPDCLYARKKWDRSFESSFVTLEPICFIRKVPGDRSESVAAT